MSRLNRYNTVIHETQCIINRSVLTPDEFNKLEEIEIQNLMTAIEAINARKDTIVRLVMAAKKRNGTFDHNDKYNLDTLV